MLSHVIPLLAATLPQHAAAGSSNVDTPALLLTLRALRNLCAGSESAQDEFCASCVALHLAALCRGLLAEETRQRGELVTVALQALGNACVRHARNQQLAWCAREHAPPRQLHLLSCSPPGTPSFRMLFCSPPA